MKVFAKIRWIASILLVFFIVLVTNLIDRDNFNRLSYSVTTMYEDRIVASDLLFEMLRIIHEKQLALLTSDTTLFEKQNHQFNQELNQLVERYKLTKLTEKEKITFDQLQNELESLKKLEGSFTDASKGKILTSIDQIDQYLHNLSKIQLQEGKRQVFVSQKAKDSINLFTQVEIISLILMAILVQIIILYKPKE